MTTPSGQISLSDVNTELNFPATALITMNDAAVRTLAGVPSGAISMQNLQNKSNRVTANVTISANTANYVLNTAKAPGYSAGTTDMTLTIAPSIYISSGSTGSYAFTVDTSWSPGDTVTVVNNGVIVGRGGNGGNGEPTRSNGTPAGPALLVQRATTMNNLNRIAGGGGGGGGATASFNYGPGKAVQVYGGGGGGGGIGGGNGGSGGSPGGGGGNPGSLTAAGPGGGGGGTGGTGGGYGASGANGGGAPSSGGAAGACIVGNSNITYINTGTRNGSIS